MKIEKIVLESSKLRKSSLLENAIH